MRRLRDKLMISRWSALLEALRLRPAPMQFLTALAALGLLAFPARAIEVRFTASELSNSDILLSPDAKRVLDGGREAVRLEKGATIRTSTSVAPPKTGFSMLLRIRINELGDPTVGDRAHNHAVLCHPSMVLIVTWGEVLLWHFPFHELGKVAEANTRFKPGQQMALGWVLTLTTMTAYVNGSPIAQVELPAPLAAKVFKPGPFIIGGPYGTDRALSLDVYSFTYSDEPWGEAEMVARVAETPAKLSPETFPQRPVAGNPSLTAGPLRLWVRAGTGQVDGFSHEEAPGRPPVRSLDIYRAFEGPCSSESEDRVVAQTRRDNKGRPALAVTCRNQTLGLQLTKEYSLDPATGELMKALALRAERPLVVAVESRTVVSDEFRRGAFYSQWLHHAHKQRLFIPAAEVEVSRSAAPEASMQSQLLLLTRPDLKWTYGEVPLSIDQEPVYPAIPDAAFGRKTLFTPDGWQVLRGVVELQTQKAHTIVTSYRWASTSHLGFVREYTQRVYRPAFAPQSGSRLSRRNLACDAGAGLFLCNLARRDGDKLIYNGRPGNWAVADLSALIKRLLPQAYATLVVFEGFSHGDLLSDNVCQWVPEDRGGPKHGQTNIFKTSLAEYMRIMKLAQHDMPQLHLGRYERIGVMSYVTETPNKRPDILAPPEAGAPMNPAVYPMPYFWEDKPTYERDTNPIVYFDLLGDYFARLTKLGLPIAYLDYAVPSPYVRRTSDGAHLISWAQQIVAVREMARKVHAAGGTYFANLPSGPWTDFGYMEYTPWAEDNAKDWRVLADRLQLSKAQEMLPNTTVPLYFQGRDYPLRCLAYNLVPNPFFTGWFDHSGTGPVLTEELLRLRWALRDAEVTGALVRPLPWEPGAAPIEACVMRLGQELYLPLIYHGDKPTELQLSADLRGLLRAKNAPVWRCDLAQAPWNGPADKPFTTDRVELKFTRLRDALDESSTLHLKGSLEPERLTMILIGDWSKHPPFAP